MVYTYFLIAGWSSPVARRAHNPKVEGSNPSPAMFSFEYSPFISIDPPAVWDTITFWERMAERVNGFFL